MIFAIYDPFLLIKYTFWQEYVSITIPGYTTPLSVG